MVKVKIAAGGQRRRETGGRAVGSRKNAATE
jgi:hypothetical protein